MVKVASLDDLEPGAVLRARGKAGRPLLIISSCPVITEGVEHARRMTVMYGLIPNVRPYTLDAGTVQLFVLEE